VEIVKPIHHKLIHIFKAGTHTASDGAPITFDNPQLDFIASAYNTGISKAPLVLGHPADSAPAFGEVLGLLAKEGNLYAHTAPNQALVDMVRRGHYTKVSVSFHAPNSSDNPVPGMYFLRHLGFLGAQPPAVKGLGAFSFGEPIALDFSDSGDGDSIDDNLSIIKQFQSVCPNLGTCEAALLLGL
jgi:hypothetical protein